MRFKFNLGTFWLFILFKIYMLLNMFIVVYLSDTEKENYAIKVIFDFGVGMWFWFAIIFYLIGEIIFDMVGRYKNRIKQLEDRE